mgnify:CR=1 FL=1
MTKQEFLETMRLALNGKVDSGQVMENLHYYEDYINTEVRKGTPESEVLEKLGDPRLLARTITETGGSARVNTGGGDYSWQYEEEEEAYMPYDQSAERKLRFLAKVPVWAWVMLAMLLVVVVLGTIFSILAAVLPILLPILVVLFLVKMFRDWIN